MARPRIRTLSLVLCLLLTAGGTGAAQTPPAPELQAAKTAIRRHDYPGAVAILSDPALQQNPEALYMLASMYQTGRGVAVDLKRAFELTAAAAALDHVDAQYSLGRMYLAGRGTAQDRQAAQKWIARAAEAGNPKAMALLVNLINTPEPATPPAQAAPRPRSIDVARIRRSDISERFGWTPLMEAARRGQHELMARLLRENAPIEARDTEGRSALILATMAADPLAVRLLLQQGAQVDAPDKAGDSALAYAAANGKDALVDILLEAGARPDRTNLRGETPIEKALQAGEVAIARRMLPPVISVLPVETVKRLWLTGVERGDPAFLEMLVERGAGCYLDDENGHNSVWLAAAAGNRQNVEYCYSSGSGVDEADRNGLTPLMVAVANGHSEVADFLIAMGADVTARTGNGNTALLFAAGKGNLGTVQALVGAGADVDHRNDNGDSALMVAARQGRRAIVQYLVRAGADIGLRNHKRERARDVAVAAGHAELVELLK